MKNYCIKLFLIGGLVLGSVPAASGYQLPTYPGLTLNEREMTLERYFQRDDSSMSKLLYLIDLLAKSDVEIVYKGRSFSPRVVTPMVRLFMMRHHNNQPAEDWLRTWCNPKFYIRFPDGSTKQAIQLLLQELQYLS